MTGPILECRDCHAPVTEGARKCGSCGADVPTDVAAQGPPSEAPARAEGRQPPDEPAPEGSKSFDEQVKSFLYLCPSCGTFVRAEDSNCKKCGAALGEQEDAGVTASAAVSQDLRRCSECGAAVPAAQATCGVCGASLAGAGTELQPASEPPAPEPSSAPTGPEAIATDEDLLELERLLTKGRPKEQGSEPAGEQPPQRPPPSREPVTKRAAKEERAAPAPSRGRATRPVSPSLAPWRELTVLMTGLAAPVTALAAALGAPGHEWGQLFVFGVLLGIGLNLTVPEARRSARSLPFLVWILGTALVLAVPAAALAGSPPGAFAAIALLAAGSALASAAGWRLPRALGVTLPWLSGLLLLTMAGLVPIAFRTFGDPNITISLWLAGGALAVGPAVLVLRRRTMRAAATRALAGAEEALSKRNYGRALRLYDEALALSERLGRDPGGALYGKGAALVAIGELDDGLEALNRALSANPRNEVAWVNKGTALTRLGRLQEALKCYNSAIKVNARYEVAWNNKGNALSRLGKDEGALQCYEQALSLDPSYRAAWVNRGYVLAKLGRFDEAAECADRALQLTAGASA